MKKFLICLIIFSVSILLYLGFKNYYKSLNKLHFKIYDEKMQNYCKNLLEEDLYILANENYKSKYKGFNFTKPDKNKCIEILDYGNMFDMSWLGSYNNKRSEILLNKFINNTEQQFAYDVKFIEAFKNKVKLLNETSKKIVNNEFPNPEEGRETRLYIYNRFASLNYVQIDILKGFVAEYCLKNFEDGCYKKIYDRFGRIN